jgi:hypothetical protein
LKWQEGCLSVEVLVKWDNLQIGGFIGRMELPLHWGDENWYLSHYFSFIWWVEGSLKFVRIVLSGDASKLGNQRTFLFINLRQNIAFKNKNRKIVGNDNKQSKINYKSLIYFSFLPKQILKKRLKFPSRTFSHFNEKFEEMLHSNFPKQFGKYPRNGES